MLVGIETDAANLLALFLLVNEIVYCAEVSAFFCQHDFIYQIDRSLRFI